MEKITNNKYEMSVRHKYIIAVVILFIFVFIPKFFLVGAVTLLIPFFFLIVCLALYNKSGWSILILALSFTFPYSGYLSEEDTHLLSEAMWLPFNVVRASILFVFICKFIRQNNNTFPKYSIKTFGSFLGLSVFYFIYNKESKEVADVLSWFTYTYLAYYVAHEEKISLKQFFFFIDIIFYCTAFYVVQEFIFHSSPYEVIYNKYIYIEKIRAKGLLGHPLILSVFLCYYQVCLYGKMILFKQKPYLTFLLLIIIGLMTASRTTIILFIVVFIVYIIVEIKNNRHSKVISIGFTLIGAIIIIICFFSTYIDNTFQRIYNAGADQRIGAYDVIWQIFIKNPLGVGLTGLKMEIESGNYRFSELFSKELMVIDNMYLSALGHYGIFSFLIIILYICPLIHFRYYVKDTNSKNLFSLMIMLYVIWFLLNFSFDTNVYVPINLFLFTFISFLGKEMKMYVLNKSNLVFNVSCQIKR
ncbi:O-antigen ligase family protein [Spirosoma sp. RP8]|uniref:O-antigen ligase family protein n=1 Tax=Spirosoma liriopis TaxID=2937440 RepID=A0ABT0HNL2_9BACT|nr:O-antigen ligase family protein [Spirosoma liriopis]MCK8493756.1 O-antigen ligase family protein [Spirosoma liriopis]